MKKLISLFFVCLLLISCGTTKSLDEVNYVQYAVVTVNDDLTVTGMLVNQTDSTISVAVDGANITYDFDLIAGYEVEMRPSSHKMQKDIVKNTNATASNTGFFVVLTVISMVALVLLQNVQ